MFFMIDRIKKNIEEIIRLNNIYMNDATPEDMEDELIAQMDNLVAETTKLLLEFINKMEPDATERLIRFYPDRVLAVIEKYRGY